MGSRTTIGIQQSCTCNCEAVIMGNPDRFGVVNRFGNLIRLRNTGNIHAHFVIIDNSRVTHRLFSELYQELIEQGHALVTIPDGDDTQYNNIVLARPVDDSNEVVVLESRTCLPIAVNPSHLPIALRFHYSQGSSNAVHPAIAQEGGRRRNCNLYSRPVLPIQSVSRPIR